LSETVYLLLGSNLGNREEFLARAVEELSGVDGMEIMAVSPVYSSEARDVSVQQPAYLNQAVKARYAHEATDLLTATEQIERRLGRRDKGKRLARTLDIDLLLFGRRVVNSPDLVLPHPGLLERPFAMVPLLALEPDIIHPKTGRPVAESLSRQERASVTRYKDHGAGVV
jgi:2-amino-4-hydroxy-6-hydroxymethyldihydropteridine diphosphokinase